MSSPANRREVWEHASPSCVSMADTSLDHNNQTVKAGQQAGTACGQQDREKRVESHMLLMHSDWSSDTTPDP